MSTAIVESASRFCVVSTTVVEPSSTVGVVW